MLGAEAAFSGRFFGQGPMSELIQKGLPSGVIAVVKRGCPTCALVEPVLESLDRSLSLTVYCQDDPAFPQSLSTLDDTHLEFSWNNEIETVPTLLHVVDGREVARTVGWHRGEWESLTGVSNLGLDLPEMRPGCGSLSVDPEYELDLAVRFGGDRLKSRRIELARLEDEMESLYDRGWSDGLPLVPPTERRVMAMLKGTSRSPDELVAIVPPDLVECTVEKVAINAVMAGCKPEYLPVVLAAVEAACTDRFNMHGLLATTMTAGPVIIVNGPIRKAIGMNSGRNVFGQGNRANATIGRALQLVIRNVGGGRPGEIDRATFGGPGKITFCFAEDEEGSPWTPLSADFGVEPGVSSVTLFPGEGPRTLVDQLSREPESLVLGYAAHLQNMHHPKLVMAFDCVLAVGPEHARVFREAGWSKEDLKVRLHELLLSPKEQMVRGAGGMAEGLPEGVPLVSVPKFRPDGILVVHCGGDAGLFSAIIAGWVNGGAGSAPTTVEIRS